MQRFTRLRFQQNPLPHAQRSDIDSTGKAAEPEAIDVHYETRDESPDWPARTFGPHRFGYRSSHYERPRMMAWVMTNMHLRLCSLKWSSKENLGPSQVKDSMPIRWVHWALKTEFNTGPSVDF